MDTLHEDLQVKVVEVAVMVEVEVTVVVMRYQANLASRSPCFFSTLPDSISGATTLSTSLEPFVEPQYHLP